MEVVMTLFRRHAKEIIMPAFDKPDRPSLQVTALRLPPSRKDSISAQTGACCGAGWLSFRRIVYIPFDACMAALEDLLREGNHGEIYVGQSRLRAPIKHDRRSGTCRVEVRLARGPLRPALRMRLNIDHWSPPSSTALELIPRRRIRASASYFRAGHLLMDSLIHSLQLEREMQALEAAASAVLHHPDEVRLEGGEGHDAVRHLPAVPGRAREELRRDPARRRASGPARLRSGIAVPWHHAARSSRADVGPFGGARTPLGTASDLYATAARAPLARPPASRPARPPFSPGQGARLSVRSVGGAQNGTFCTARCSSTMRAGTGGEPG
jgi:hypothetical protein